MGLGNYALACTGLAEELRDSLTESEIEELHKLWTGRSTLDWMAWRGNNQKLVAELVASTRTARNKKKFKQQRLLLTMAAVQHCAEAHALLTEADSLWPGESHRSMAATAGEAFFRLMYYSDVPSWPFDELPSPFVDESDEDALANGQ